MLEGLIQKIYQFIAPKFPDAEAITKRAMEIGRKENSPAAVMAVLEAVARNKGWESALVDNQIWQSFKNKTPEQVIPHAQALLKETGHLGAVISFFTKGGQPNG